MGIAKKLGRQTRLQEVGVDEKGNKVFTRVNRGKVYDTKGKR